MTESFGCMTEPAVRAREANTSFVPAQRTAWGNDPNQRLERQRRGLIPAWASGPGHDRKSAKGLKAPCLGRCPRLVWGRAVGAWLAEVLPCARRQNDMINYSRMSLRDRTAIRLRTLQICR
jgi:hypothetical protein